MVMFTPEGQVLAEWNVLGEEPWSRFSRDVDYRKIVSKKPRLSHHPDPIERRRGVSAASSSLKRVLL